MQVYISHGRLLLSFSHGKREDGSSPITGDPRERDLCTRVSCGPVKSVTSRAGPGRGVRGERRWGAMAISRGWIPGTAVLIANFTIGIPRLAKKMNVGENRSETRAN